MCPTFDQKMGFRIRQQLYMIAFSCEAELIEWLISYVDSYVSDLSHLP